MCQHRIIKAYSMLHRLDNLCKKALKIHVGRLSQRWLTFRAYILSQRRLDFSANSANLAPTQLEFLKNLKVQTPVTRQVIGLIQNRRNIFHDCVYLHFDGV